MKLDIPTASLIGSALLFIASIVTLIFNRRDKRADTLTKLEGIIDKVQERADKLYDEKVACEVGAEKLRGDLAISLVTIADLKNDLSKKEGYIQGITDPIIKMEQAHTKDMQGGRRATDSK